MTQGAEATRGLVGAGGELMMRVYTHPQPVVAAVTGHALAAGALLCLACDTRIGSADLPAKIGLNETAIGMGLPWYGIRLGEARLSMRYRQRSILQAEIFDMAGALDAGYLDELVAGRRRRDHRDRAGPPARRTPGRGVRLHQAPSAPGGRRRDPRRPRRRHGPDGAARPARLTFSRSGSETTPTGARGRAVDGGWRPPRRARLRRCTAGR